VGTGRIARPLSQNGTEVVGVDTSRAMLDRLVAGRAAGGGAVHAVLADMALLPFRSDTFSVAFAAYNTLFNLTTAAAARRCLDHVSRVLRPDGAFVVESFVAGYESGSHTGVEVRAVGIDHVVLTASVLDTQDQTITGQHIEIRESGIRMRPWCLRYLELDELDDMARASGLTPVERWAGWRREPFTPEADVHVSVYRATGREGLSRRS
jgi:SAM-dependent methyltransferase